MIVDIKERERKGVVCVLVSNSVFLPLLSFFFNFFFTIVFFLLIWRNKLIFYVCFRLNMKFMIRVCSLK